jgi:outer membrane receptor protein involved in Fe transport
MKVVVKLFSLRKRHWLALLAVLSTAVLLFATAPIEAATFLDRQVTFWIPSQPLDSALIEFSRQAGVQVAVDASLLGRIQAPELNGTLQAGVALTRLLGRSGLVYSAVGNTVTIRRENGDHSRVAVLSSVVDHRGDISAASQAASDSVSDSSDDQDNRRKEPTTEAGLRRREFDSLYEVIVSAEKRDERLQDVPVPMTAINADTLVEQNTVRLMDYYTSVPGLDVTPQQTSSASQRLTIRGMTTGAFTNPTVAVTVDDVPYGSSTFLGGGGYTVVPDIDPSDLARIEVLRGPQGTLYGASSLGGLLKFVTVDPSTDGVSGRMQVGASSVYNGAQLGYNARGAINVPVSDDVALRASAFTRLDPGYIDNPALHIDGINVDRVSGGRLAALWRPSDVFSLKLSALYQNTRGDGTNDVTIANPSVPQTSGLGDLQQNYLTGVGGHDSKIQAYSATLNAALGGVKLTSVTGYNVNSYSDSYDVTYALGTFAALPTFGVTGSPVFEQSQNSKFSEELRLSASVGSSLDWLFGGFYTHERTEYSDSIFGEDPATGAIVGQGIYTRFAPTYTEYAAFADVTYHVSSRFDVQFGGRQSHIRDTYQETDIGPYVPFFLGISSLSSVSPIQETTANAFTYLATPRLRLSTDLMLYARLASGYRPGGPNFNAGLGTPPTYSPDKTENYEVGLKGELLNRKLSFDASIYHIDWKDIQVSSTNPETYNGYTGNGGKAKSQGVELSTEWRPVGGFMLASWVTWDDAVLTQMFPPTSTEYGAAGDRLPYTSRFSGNVSLQREFPITNAVSGSVGGTVSYIGERWGEFTPTARRQAFPGYTKTDLWAAARFGSWTVNVYVNNVADRRALVNGGYGGAPPFDFVVIPPRVAGISLSTTL